MCFLVVDVVSFFLWVGVFFGCFWLFFLNKKQSVFHFKDQIHEQKQLAINWMSYLNLNNDQERVMSTLIED